MRVELRRMLTQLEITAVYVTHDQTEAMVLSDRVAVMSQGRIEQVGDPKTIYQHPATRFVAEFLGAANFIEGVVVETMDWPLIRVRVDDTLCGAVLQCRVRDRIEPGRPALLALRPERLRIAGGRAANGNVLDGLVTEVYYLGDRYEYRVRVHEKTLRVQTVEDLGVLVGTGVQIVLPPESFVLVQP